MKILVNALSGIGDALMFSPALRRIKEQLPESRIDFLVMYKSVKELYSQNPFIDNLFLIDFFKQSKFKSIQDVLKLRKNKYDYSINIYPSNRAEYNILNFLLGAKIKISFRYNHTHFLRLQMLNTILLEEISNKHNVLQNLELAKKICNNDDLTAGQMEIFTDESSDSKAIEWFKNNGLTDRLLIGFHPGSSTIKNHINKRWDKYKFVELAKKLILNFNAKILLFGNEFDLNNEIMESVKDNIILASTDNFLDSLSRLKKCSLFITNDTAFLHCASAFGVPVVAIFAYTNQNELFPWNTRHIVVRKDFECSPCFYNSPKPISCIWKGSDEFKCMKSISLDDVYNACETLIKEIPYDSKS